MICGMVVVRIMMGMLIVAVVKLLEVRPEGHRRLACSWILWLALSKPQA